MKGFVWRIVCPGCGNVFSPVNEDVNEVAGITCPKCTFTSFIEIEDTDMDIVEDEQMESNSSGNHIEWPENLSNWELDQVYKSIDMIPRHFETIMKEYQRRGLPTPRKA